MSHSLDKNGQGAPLEKPQNGLAGLKHWRYDIRSGFMVALVSLPFSMGIAITSGAPPVCGIMSAIIAGFVLPFLGGSYVTISGPAAGLAPALFAGMYTLGDGELSKGYPILLVAILLCGVAQVILAKLKVARLSAIFPAAAIEGMLAAIGLLIIVKQIPLFMGVKFEAHEFWEILAEVPAQVSGMNQESFWLGVGCLTALFTLAAIPSKLLKVMPPPVWVFIVGTVVSLRFLHLSGSQLINVPEAPLANGLVFPDFRAAFSAARIWDLMVLVVVILMINGTESLATIAAVDKIDPFKRKSDPDRTLFAMGISNMCSSMLGGLTIIPGIVKSTANILGGGRTQWANFYNACFLLTFLIFARAWINLVPYCVLASILVFVGFKLCRPLVWRLMWRVGKEQFLVFSTTVLVTVTTDLLIGIAVGVGMKYALMLWYSMTVPILNQGGLLSRAVGLFRNPVTSRDLKDGVYSLNCSRPLVCFNLFHLFREIDQMPQEAREIKLCLADGVALVDHTTCEALHHYVSDYTGIENGNGGSKPRFEVIGLERMKSLSKHESSIRIACVDSIEAMAASTGEQ